VSEIIRTTGDLFQCAIQLEKTAEFFYRRLGELFADYPDVVQFWNRFADEEHEHAVFLEEAREAVADDRLSLPVDESMLQRTKGHIDIRSRVNLESINDLEDAYQLALDLENSEINLIFEFMITNFSTRALKRSHKFLRKQLSEHIAELEQGFPIQYRSRVARQSVKVSRFS
jgi:Rubrerythrin